MPEFTQLPFDFKLPSKGRQKKEKQPEPDFVTLDDGTVDLGEYEPEQPRERRRRWTKKMVAEVRVRSEEWNKRFEFFYLFMAETFKGGNVMAELTTAEAIEKVFTYRSKPEDVQKYLALRDKAKELALLINEQCPPSPDRTIAIRKVREAIMYANSSIACEGVSPK